MTNKPIWNMAINPVGGYSGLWNHIYGERYSQIDSQNFRRGLGLALHGRGRFKYNRIIYSFLYGDLGTVALAQNIYIKAQDVNDFTTLGGYRPTTTFTQMNRPVTEADRTAVNQDLTYHNSPLPWPVDKANNGGGGKAGL